MSIDRLTAALTDRYRIERELGQGGMATVYLAQDLKHDRKVAIKVLRPELAAVIGADRFLSEIKTTANLQHPHILPLFDSGAADSFLFYAMPFVEGESLRDRLNREKQLPIADAVRLAGEVAAALDYAHRHGVIHRDIKPENILLHDGRALVADFGIALAASKAGGTRMTETGMSLGTPTYMSPEQAMGEREITARSDVYALGCMTYEMLLGEPPFTGPTAQSIVAKVMTEKPASLIARRERIPAWVEDAVLTALEKLPADRFSSAAEFARALTGERAGVRAATSSVATGMSASTRERALDRRLIPWLAALTAVSAAAGWGVSELRRTAASSEPLTITSIVPPVGGSFAERRSLALSPDGRKLAFVYAAADGSRMLWLRSLDRATAEPIPHTAGGDAPFWSPDGRSIGYFADGNLTVVDGKGDSRQLCPVTYPTGGTWSAKGQILFGDRTGISSVPAGGGACRLIVPRDSAPMLKPVFLPDGERFLYARGRTMDFAVAALDGTRQGTIPLRGTELAFVPPDYILSPSPTDFRALDAQRVNLRTFALEGPATRIASEIRGSSGILTASFSGADAFAFLPSTIDRPYLEYDATGLLRDTIRVEGTWTLRARPPVAGPALVAVAGTTTGLWLYDLDADRATRLVLHDAPGMASSVHRGPAYPVFDRTGTKLAYAEISASRCSVVERDLRTDAERTVLPDSSFATTCPAPLDWSPDGQRMLVRWDTVLVIIDPAGSAPRTEITRPGRLWDARFSPDGHTIAYSSDETGRAEIYVQPLPAGATQRVSLQGGRWPAWVHGGQELIFLTPDGRVQRATIGARQDGPIGAPRTLFVVPTWRRSLFDDPGSGFEVVGDGDRYLVRQSPSGLAVSYVQHWRTLMQHADSNASAATHP